MRIKDCEVIIKLLLESKTKDLKRNNLINWAVLRLKGEIDRTKAKNITNRMRREFKFNAGDRLK